MCDCRAVHGLRSRHVYLLGTASLQERPVRSKRETDEGQSFPRASFCPSSHPSVFLSVVGPSRTGARSAHDSTGSRFATDIVGVPNAFHTFHLSRVLQQDAGAFLWLAAVRGLRYETGPPEESVQCPDGTDQEPLDRRELHF